MYLFPFEQVVSGSRVVLYGAGTVGQCYLQQIKMTRYCDVICVVDKAYAKYPEGLVPLYAPSKLSELSFDKIIIAVDSQAVANDISLELQERYHVSLQTIVYGNGRRFRLDMQMKMEATESVTGKLSYQKEGISVAVYLGGGLGDCIIAKRLIAEIIDKAHGKGQLDIYASAGNIDFIQSVFQKMKALNRCFVGKNSYLQERNHYDVALEIAYFLSLDSFHEAIVREKDCEFANVFSRLQEHIRSYGLSLQRPTDFSVHFLRTKFAGLDCYTGYRYDGVFAISNHQVQIPLTLDGMKGYQRLDLSERPYITINFGWGSNINGKGKLPNKVWPISAYGKFVGLFKTRFPDIGILQVGVAGCYQIPGVNRYILGQTLEVIKYVLKEAILHIDCEGGLVHLATQLGTKCVVLFGPTPVHFFGYEENINIVSEKCNGCYYVNENFAICAKGLEEPECMRAITPEKVMDALVNYMDTVH